MPKLSASALKARIDQLQKQLAAAEANKGPAVKKVRQLMKKLGVSLEDLVDSESLKRISRGAQKSGENPTLNDRTVKTRKARPKVPVKYRDQSGNTWTGRGKTPRWLAEAEKAGKTRESFRIS